MSGTMVVQLPHSQVWPVGSSEELRIELVKINTVFFDHLEWNLYLNKSKILSVYCHFKLVSFLCFTEESSLS